MRENVDIKVLDLGYLTGIDLMQYLAESYLDAVYDKGSDNLMRAVHMAQSIVQNYLASLYDLRSEYEKRGWDRNGVVLRLVIFAACWEIASGDEAIKKSLVDAYRDFRITIDELQNKKQSLLDVPSVDSSILSSPEVVSTKCQYLY
jgi:hypothetical protein